MNNGSPAQRDQQAGNGEDAAEITAVPRRIASPAPYIEAWLCGLERGAREIDELAASLSPSERERAARFGTDSLRNRWMAGRAALREVLGRTLGVAPADVAIRRGMRGRPELADSRARIDFNVSHTGGVALIAIARDVPPTTRIGVDIEHAEREVGVDMLQKKFLAPQERQMIADLSPDMRRRQFLHYWTCKEAMSKATADGIIAPFGQLEVELGRPPRLRAGPPPYVPADWSLVDAAVPAAWFATIAIWHRAG